MNLSAKHALPAVVGDVGGTNARFQMVLDDQAEPLAFDPVQTADYENINQAIQESVLEKTDVEPRTAIIAAAGPITPNGLNLTNCHWDIRPDDFLNAGPFQKIVLMNDFEAQALSLPSLGALDCAAIGAGHVPETPQTKAVLGPGTGLGVGLLVRAGGKWVPVAGEGGHVDIGPRSDREAAIWKHLETAKGRISAEQVVCGDGLRNLYRACCITDGKDPYLSEPSEISGRAMAGTDQQAVEALTLFCTCLGRVAGDLALTSMARGGVYISGGIGRKILPFLEASPFRNAFEDKAPHEVLTRQMATLVVTHDLPALLGLTAYARNPDTFALDIDHRCWTK